jgi:hypothetical protein
LKNEDIFYNKYISNIKIDDWYIPVNDDIDYFKRNIEGLSSVKIENDFVFKTPDLLLLKDNKYSVAIEEFEVDGSPNNGKGSKNLEEYHDFFEQHDKISKKTNETCQHSKDFNYDFSIDNYIKNFKKVFKKHYKKIEQYKENLGIVSKKKLDIGFMVVDNFHNPVIFNGDKYFSPLNANELVSFIEKHSKVDFFIFFQKNAGSKPNLTFIRNDKNSIDFIRDNIIKVNEETIFNNPKTKHVVISIKESLKITAEIKIEASHNNILESSEEVEGSE